LEIGTNYREDLDGGGTQLSVEKADMAHFGWPSRSRQVAESMTDSLVENETCLHYPMAYG